MNEFAIWSLKKYIKTHKKGIFCVKLWFHKYRLNEEELIIQYHNLAKGTCGFFQIFIFYVCLYVCLSVYKTRFADNQPAFHVNQ